MVLVDEENFVKTFRAFVAEWGPENVTINAPVAWKDLKIKFDARCTLKFENENKITISARSAHHSAEVL